MLWYGDIPASEIAFGEVDCDVFVPAAMENALTEENAWTLPAKLVLEAANHPTTPEADRILVEYLDGPFRHLENHWTFRPLGEGTSEIGFYISYEFKNRALSALMSAMFDRAFRKFSDAFEARADVVYGGG